ncbi:acyl-CoA ligase (AMP-forming), exosortase A system-associated [Rhodoferax sp. GW822-FHT02A01]|uniref:acyl-CoA ligase (AMP-forming), exosortase A system-associated n=1 Tax=Rhodoferax sp. GW822-FHT02A01 TaxID=3141537 RepID=UPI00315CA270
MSSLHNTGGLLHELVAASARRTPEATALVHGEQSLSYLELNTAVGQFASGLLALGVQRNERVAVYLEKRMETVVSSFGASAAGAVHVPVNPLLKAEQVAYVLRDCNVRVLVTSVERLALLREVLGHCPDLQHVVLVTSPQGGEGASKASTGAPVIAGWDELLSAPASAGHRVIDTDMAAILYTSGSTGSPKGVVLSHRNMVVGAHSVNAYLENTAQDTLLAVLPLSFDAGFSQLTTAFAVGARVALLNYLMPRDVLKAMQQHRVTGLTAVPPLYMQLAQLSWPDGVTGTLRYFANTGGRMPQETLRVLRERAPQVKPFLMYGLTEAFRSTYLHPDQVDLRPDSIGKAIPNAEVLVLRADGSECAADEPGELVHRGPLVSLGYWNNPEQTAERFKPLTGSTPWHPAGLQLPEYAVFSGDTVRRDAQGYLYFVGRKDEMIKTSGYRVSPTEVEEAIHATGRVIECVAFGVDHPVLGQVIQVLVYCTPDTMQSDVQSELLDACRAGLPAYMVPAGVQVVGQPLPRNMNGKIDRKGLRAAWITDHQGTTEAKHTLP